MLKKNDNGEAAAAFYDKRRKWLDYVCERDDISDRAFRVGHWLAKRMNGDTQCTWPATKTIANALCVSPRKVLRAIQELENANLIIVVRKHRSSNHYFIRLPFG